MFQTIAEGAFAIKLYLIRHGQTEGNRLRQYIGSTDQPLCSQGREQLMEKKRQGYYPEKLDLLYLSPMLRCRQTAGLLYPQVPAQVLPGFRETDFGAYEQKTYEQLCQLAPYQKFLETGGETAFPGGESRSQVLERVKAQWEQLVLQLEEGKRYGLIVHGGTIMALCYWYGCPRGDFYRWQLGCGEGLAVTLSPDRQHFAQVTPLESGSLEELD